MMIDLLGEDATKISRDYACQFEVIQKKKIFVMVDDISNVKQFDELVSNLKQLALGSQVLLTS